MGMTTTLSAAVIAALVGTIPAAAADMSGYFGGNPGAVTPPRSRHPVEPDRTADADALALLAPLSRRSTANQDYGDAAYARDRAYRHPPRASGYGEGMDAGYESTPERPFGFRPGFTYGPAYLSAPQIFGGSRTEQTPLLPFLGE